MAMKTVLIWSEDMKTVLGSVRYDDKFIKKDDVLCPGPGTGIPHYFPRRKKDAVEELIAMAKKKALKRMEQDGE